MKSEIAKIRFLILLLFLFPQIVLAGNTQNSPNVEQYCVGVEKIDFNPFRPIVDGKDVAFLLLLRSYISTDKSEKGLLEAYEFSPDGKIFTGRMSKDLNWSDGSPVKPFELAVGIAKGMRFRTLGQRVSVIGTETIAQPGWAKRKYNGIEILDARTFRLLFKSDISNLTGVVREAISTGSRHNRLWPIKLIDDSSPASPEVIAKLPTVKVGNHTGLNVSGRTVELVENKSCTDPHFTIFMEWVADKVSGFDLRKTPVPSAVTLQTNIRRLNLDARKALIEWTRKAFVGVPLNFGVKNVDSFFLKGESGYNPNLIWGSKPDLKILKNLNLIIAYEIPSFRTILEAAAKADGLNFKFLALPSKEKIFDAQILASSIQDGRHIILQDILKWEHVNDLIEGASATAAALRKISAKSASTIPVDNSTLGDFEQVAILEQSLAPIARKSSISFSLKSSKSCLDWTDHGELNFLNKEFCKPVLSNEVARK
jgi:hypothetical protein